MNKKILTLFMLLFGMVLLAGCDNDDDPVTLTGISTSPASVPDGLPIGVSQQFTATGSYSDGSVQPLDSSVTWSSSAPTTAFVDVNGLATAEAVGTADITASVSGVTSNAVAVKVINPTLQTITIAPPVVSSPLVVGRSMSFTAEGVFDNTKAYEVTDYVTWDSNNQGVATIDATGVATAATAGTTDIQASAAGVDSNIVALTTADLAPDSLTIEPQSLDALPVGRDKQLVALLKFADGSMQSVTDTAIWKSDDSTIADVGNSSETKGVVSGRKAGTATITATDPDTGLADVQTVSVNDATIVLVTVTPENPADLPAGTTQAFTALGEFSDGIDRILTGYDTWSVSNTEFASIRSLTEDGPIAVVRGEAPGDVSVVYKDVLITGERTDVEGSTDLTVTEGFLQSIDIFYSPVAPDVPADVSVQFTAIGAYGSGPDRDITQDVIWTSSDQDVGVFDTATRGKLHILPGTAAGSSTDVTASMLNTANPPDEIESPTTTVSVNAAVLTNLLIAPDNPTVIAGGDRIQLQATAFFGDVGFDYTERVTWSSDNEDFATVSNDAGTQGQVTGVSVGSVTIRAKDPNTSIETNTRVNVTQP